MVPSVRWPILACLVVAGTAGLAACADRDEDDGSPVTRRLTTLFSPDLVEGTREVEPEAPAVSWFFTGPPLGGHPGPAATRGWRAVHDVAGLAVRDGRLSGRTKGDLPLVAAAWEPPPVPDVVHAIEIRLSASAGTELAVSLRQDEGGLDEGDLLAEAGDFGLPLSVPLVAGPEAHTYVVTLPRGRTTGTENQLVIRPTNATDAIFEIVTVRVVLRREHLASVPSGPGWHGLGDVWREALAVRTPELVFLPLRMPPDPVMTLAVGTPAAVPITFRVGVLVDAVTEFTELEARVTTPNRWEEFVVDLSRYSGAEVTVVLRAGGSPGRLAFWGAPVLRRGFARPGRFDLREPMRRAVASRQPHNVVLVMADTLRADHLGSWGHSRNTAPTLARLAREGARFADCHAQATWTRVSAPSILTSLHPSSHGVADVTDRLPPAAETLTESLRDAGWATWSLSSDASTGRSTGLEQGFEVLHESSSLEPRDKPSKTAREAVDRLIPWIEHHRDVPFFAFLHVLDPHAPYRPMAPFDRLWVDDERARAHEDAGERLRAAIDDPLLRRLGMPSLDELREAGVDPEAWTSVALDWYDASIRGLDIELTRLLSTLRNLDLDRSTLVVFTSDHGEEFHEHGRMSHGQSVYGELSHVPLVLWAPGLVAPGVEIEETVATIDVMPTVLDLLGVEVPPGVQGTSHAAAVLDEERADAGEGGGGASVAAPVAGRDAASGDGPPSAPDGPASGTWPPVVVVERPDAVHPMAPPPRGRRSVAVLSGDWKLVEHVEELGAPPAYELFHRPGDPFDQQDRAASEPDVVERMRELLEAWRARVQAERLAPEHGAAVDLSTADLEQLKELGYVK